ncbi:ATP-binding protein [Streptomyces sp. NPDC046909]|uniref:ATP-binding protein n=1 Tax=Streptomyces sp. NPDC046909 TaxID=3155617 RepID=UPI0033C99587
MNGTPAADVQETVLAACAPGRSRAVLIEGAPGLGKTTLLDVVAREAASGGAVVLRAGGGGRAQPYGVMRQLLDGSAELERTGLFDGDTAAAFCGELLGLARRRPVVLCVDDVQGADAQSLHALRYVVRYVRTAPVVVAATRATYGGSWQEMFTAEVLRRPQVQRVRLGLLGVGDVERVLEGRLAGWGEGAQVHAAARLHRLSGGNPLLLRALLAEDGLVRQPSVDGAFGRAVADCLRRSGAAAVAAARALAVLGGHPVEPALLAELVDGGASEALDGLGALRACGLLDGLARREPVVRAATLADCDAGWRARLGLRAAHALRATGASAVAVAGPLLALGADGVRGSVGAADRLLLVRTARELVEAGRVLREQGRRDRAKALLRAARRLSLQAGEAGEVVVGDEGRVGWRGERLTGAVA